MKWFALCALLLTGVMLALVGSGCEDLKDTLVRFENNSQSKSVYAVWDNARYETLAPGQKTEWTRANPGTHTLQWFNAANGKPLTSLGWPNVPNGGNYTFPYND